MIQNCRDMMPGMGEPSNNGKSLWGAAMRLLSPATGLRSPTSSPASPAPAPRNGGSKGRAARSCYASGRGRGELVTDFVTAKPLIGLGNSRPLTPLTPLQALSRHARTCTQAGACSRACRRGHGCNNVYNVNRGVFVEAFQGLRSVDAAVTAVTRPGPGFFGGSYAP